MAWGVAPPIRSLLRLTHLFMQGSAADEAYLVIEGNIRLRRDNPIEPVIVDDVGRGQWIGIGEVLNGVPFSTSAIATENSSVLPVTRELLERLTRRTSPLIMRALRGAAQQQGRLLEAVESRSLTQTFLGLCRGIELLFGSQTRMPEGQLLTQLHELFGIPTLSLLEALRLLEGLNLIVRRQEPGKEAIFELPEKSTFSARVQAFSDKWRNRLPALIGEAPPPEPIPIDALCSDLGIPPAQLLRRMLLPDFPLKIVQFDPNGVKVLRETMGDGFFKKRVSGRELLSRLESIDELIDVEVSLLRDVLPRLELSQLIRLLAGVDAGLRQHLLGAVSARVRRTVDEELPHMPETSPTELADIEQEIIAICHNL